jgi:sarcosine oxidase subunit gamma
MSDAQSALPGARFAGIAFVAEAGPVGMITLRGDFAAKGFAAAVKKACGLALPKQREVVEGGGKRLVWMSPDELLLVLPYAQTAEMAATLEAGLAGVHALVANVSDARAVFDVSGGHAREVLGKLMPVDLSQGAFGPGMIRRSRMAQVPAAIWMTGDDAFRVVVFRSVARYAFDVLCAAAAEGSEVGHYA